jgi:hypothetical protein
MSVSLTEQRTSAVPLAVASAAARRQRSRGVPSVAAALSAVTSAAAAACCRTSDTPAAETNAPAVVINTAAATRTSTVADPRSPEPTWLTRPVPGRFRPPWSRLHVAAGRAAARPAARVRASAR